tara:strand:- start:133 stop:588 length:456 start_codon:yes stop_codon:yes gene_type:complete
MGRPTKFDDPEVRRKLIEATRIGATRTIAARYAGVPESVLYAWLKRGKQGEDRYQEFREEILKASSSHAVEHLALISAHARSDKPNSWQASAWMLERRHQGYSKDPVKPDELSHEANELSIEQIKAEITHADKLLANISAPSLIDVDDDDG